MKLRLYLEQNALSVIDFAAEIGVTRQCVACWVTGLSMPSPRMMRRIIEVTAGQVRPDDFFDLPTKRKTGT